MPRVGYNDNHGHGTGYDYRPSYGAPAVGVAPNPMTAYIVRKNESGKVAGPGGSSYTYSLITYFGNNSGVVYLTDAVYMCSISKQGDMVGGDFVVNRGGFLWTPPA